MSVKTRVQELNTRLAAFLRSRFIEATADETTTALVAKLSGIPQFITKGVDLRPIQGATAYPAYTHTDGTVTDVGVAGAWNEDGAATLTSLVASDHAWPHCQCLFDDYVKVSGLRLLVDAEHSEEFNIVFYCDSPNDDYYVIHLSDMVELPSTDFPSDRTSLTVNFGQYLIAQGHCNPPQVSTKINLLELATGNPINYVHTGGRVTFGDVNGTADPLYDGTIDLNTTPYLYYSIAQDAASGCTFGLYCGSSPWYMFRDGADASAPTMDTDSDNYTGSANWIYGEQTGCVDLRQYVDESRWSSFSLRGLRLYGYASDSTDGTTNATFHYLFLGSEPTGAASDAWGEPATPTYPLLNHSAVGGSVQIEGVNYYVVGAEGATLTLNHLMTANE